MKFIKEYWLNFVVFGIMFFCLALMFRTMRLAERCECDKIPHKELKVTNIESTPEGIKVSGTALPNTKLKVIIK